MVAERAPTPTPLTPAEQARVDAYRAQWRALGLTDAEIDDTTVTDITTAEELAFLEGRGPDPWPR